MTRTHLSRFQIVLWKVYHALFLFFIWLQFRADDKDDFDPRQAAVMLMNMDEMPQSLAESTRIDAREFKHVPACKVSFF